MLAPRAATAATVFPVDASRFSGWSRSGRPVSSLWSPTVVSVVSVVFWSVVIRSSPHWSPGGVLGGRVRVVAGVASTSDRSWSGLLNAFERPARGEPELLGQGSLRQRLATPHACEVSGDRTLVVLGGRLRLGGRFRLVASTRRK